MNDKIIKVYYSVCDWDTFDKSMAKRFNKLYPRKKINRFVEKIKKRIKRIKRFESKWIKKKWKRKIIKKK